VDSSGAPDDEVVEVVPPDEVVGVDGVVVIGKVVVVVPPPPVPVSSPGSELQPTASEATKPPTHNKPTRCLVFINDTPTSSVS